MLKGSCACGRVEYELRGALIGPIGYCHCWQCRKHSGSSFGTTSPMKSAEFAIVKGEERMSSWESSPGVHRCFAGCCGSPIYKRLDAIPQVLALRLGTLDTDPGRKVEGHGYLGSKAPWVELEDTLPKSDEGAPFPER